MNRVARSKTTLSQLNEDLNRIVTPSLRKFVVSQILARQFQIRILEERINIDKQVQPPVTQPLPEKKTPPSKATTIVGVKKRVDGQNRIQL